MSDKTITSEPLRGLMSPDGTVSVVSWLLVEKVDGVVTRTAEIDASATDGRLTLANQWRSES